MTTTASRLYQLALKVPGVTRVRVVDTCDGTGADPLERGVAVWLYGAPINHGRYIAQGADVPRMETARGPDAEDKMAATLERLARTWREPVHEED